MDIEDLEKYMARRCVCGLPRSEHAHFEQDGRMILLAVTNGKCYGFIDEFELELTGQPMHNKHLRALIKKNHPELFEPDN